MVDMIDCDYRAGAAKSACERRLLPRVVQPATRLCSPPSRWIIEGGSTLIALVRVAADGRQAFGAVEQYGWQPMKPKTLFRCLFVGTLLVGVACVLPWLVLNFVFGPGDWMIGPGMHDFSANVVGDYCVYCTSPERVRISGPKLKIPLTVSELAYDQRFILVKQQLLQQPPLNEVGDADGKPIPGKYNYWIVNVTQQTCYGPFDEGQFAAKRLELKVDPSLTLRDVYFCDPRNSQSPQQSEVTPPSR